MNRAARCCCGALTVEVRGEPAFSAVCHCENCKRRTGSAFGWSVYYVPDQISAASGPIAIYAFDSTYGPVERTFCQACGSTVLWRSDAIPGLIGVAGGCFGDANFAPPAISASDDKRCAWFEPPREWSRSS